MNPYIALLRTNRNFRLLYIGQTIRVVRQRRQQHLDRDVAIQLRVSRAIDGAHAALAERGEDLEGAEARAGGERRGCQGGLIVARTTTCADLLVAGLQVFTERPVSGASEATSRFPRFFEIGTHSLEPRHRTHLSVKPSRLAAVGGRW